MAIHPDDLLLQLDDSEDLETFLCWDQVFGNGNPVQVEIGIGKGRFLIESAQRFPAVNFLGIEWASKYLRIARDRSLKRGLGNVRFVRTDAKEFVEFFVPASSIAAYHIYFPDPWPKKRHHKRRLLDPPFVAEVERTLAEDGKLWVATDHLEYFEVMVAATEASKDLAEVHALWPEIATNYETKYLALGKPIHRRVFAKSSR